MIIAKLEGEEIKITGQILEGDKYPVYNSIWGLCENPECDKYQNDIGATDHYRGISHILQEDFEEWYAFHQSD